MVKAEAAEAAEVAAKLEAAEEAKAAVEAADEAEAELEKEAAEEAARIQVADKAAEDTRIVEAAAEKAAAGVTTEKAMIAETKMMEEAARKEAKRLKEAARKRERVQRLQPALKAAQAQQQHRDLVAEGEEIRLRRIVLDREIEANQLLVKADEKAAGWTEVSSRTSQDRGKGVG